jgi:formate dehydrogenase subunit gamma
MMDKVREIAQSLASEPGALLPILHAIQDEFGYVPESAVPPIASILNLSRADVHGVISFYHLIRTTPPGRKTLYICRAESCRAMGGKALEDHARAQLGIDYHQTTADGEVSLEPVYCLGNCTCSPSVKIDDRLYSRVDPARLDELLQS